MNKKMRKNIKRREMILAGMLSLSIATIVSGCGAKPPVVDRNDTNMTQVSETDTADVAENMTQVSQTDTADNEELTQVSQSQNGTAVKETKDSVFFFGKTYIYFVDKATDRLEVLWKSDTYEPYYNVFDGCGVVLGERLYFIETAEYEKDGVGNTAFVLSAINTDGSGYEQAVSGLDAEHPLLSIYYSDNILYVYNDSCDVQCYSVLEDGSLGEQIPQEETAFRYTKDLGEDYRLVNIHSECYHFLSPVESIEKFGSLIMQKNSSYVKIDVESGSEEWVNFGAPVAMEDDKAFYIGMQSDSWKLESFDLNTKEVTTICDLGDAEMHCMTFADGMFYYMTMEDNHIVINRASAAEQGRCVLLELNDMSSYASGFSPISFGLRVLGNALYYTDMTDYEAYLLRLDLDTMEQTQFDTPIYSTGISKVGTLANEHHDIYKENDPNALIGTADFSWLVIDDSFAGAATINEYLYESEVASEWAVFEDNVQRDEEFFDSSSAAYAYDSAASGIEYFDGRYVSFIQQAYGYWGGAHGLPIWNGYTFDLETGERLLLSDIVSNTEAELKDLVTGYFSEMIDESPSDYWADAKETVHDMISLETTDFVLTEDGICFYMHPYSISAYAAGFQEVTIPYAEFQGLPFAP